MKLLFALAFFVIQSAELCSMDNPGNPDDGGEPSPPILSSSCDSTKLEAALSSGKLAALTSLDLEYNKIGTEGAKALVENLTGQRSRDLELREHTID